MATDSRARVIDAIYALDAEFQAQDELLFILDRVGSLADVLEANGRLNQLNTTINAANAICSDGRIKRRDWRVGFDAPPSTR